MFQKNNVKIIKDLLLDLSIKQAKPTSLALDFLINISAGLGLKL